MLMCVWFGTGISSTWLSGSNRTVVTNSESRTVHLQHVSIGVPVGTCMSCTSRIWQHIHTPTHKLSHTHTRTVSLSHTHTHGREMLLCNHNYKDVWYPLTALLCAPYSTYMAIHTHTLNTGSPSHTQDLSLCHTHTYTHTHTHTHTHTWDISL